MPSFDVKTPQRNYRAIVERGILGRVGDYLPPKAGKVFVVSTEDVWRHQGKALDRWRRLTRRSGVRQESIWSPERI